VVGGAAPRHLGRRGPAAANPLQQFTEFVGGAKDAINKNVVTPLIDANERADENVRETMRKEVSRSAALDGVFGIGTTRYKVEIMNGAVGEYDSDYRLLSAQKGDPPAKVDNPGLYTGGTPMTPAAPGSMPVRVPIVP
jgi:hypothetical protein